MNDNLETYINNCIEEVKDILINYLKKNPNTIKLPDLDNCLNYSGEIDNIIDSNVPIYTKEINDLWYLYRNEFEQAYDDSGFEEENGYFFNYGMGSIFLFLNNKVHNWYYNHAQEVFDEYFQNENLTK